MVLCRCLFLAVLLTATLPIFSQDPADEPCVKNAYPPDPSSKISTEIVNLDDPPEKRWMAITSARKTEIQNLVALIKTMVTDFHLSALIPLIDKDLAPFADQLPYPYGDEMKGISQATNIPLGEIVLYNIFYEVFSVCTSIIAQTKEGKLYHARNLDFGLFMGWDIVNHTWALTERLRPIVINVDYQRGGKTVFKAVHFAGYIGVLSGLKQGILTLTINERYALDGGYVGIIEWLAGDHDQYWMGFLTRDTLQNATSYSEAVQMLSDKKMLAPAYFIVGGTKSGEGTVITRDRDKTANVWSMNPSNGTWYLLETNYDHWKKPLVIDDRRTPGMQCMDKLTQQNLTPGGIYNVLSTKPVLNKLTTYTVLMQVDSGMFDSYRRTCPDFCWPF